MTDLQFSNVIDFVDQVVRRTYRRKVEDSSTRSWCAQWWRHPEAVMRLEGMWLAWEQLRAAPDGISVWMLHHADPHMAVLLAHDGPFQECKSSRGHKPNGLLPHTEPGNMRALRAARMAPSTSTGPEDVAALVEGYEQRLAEKDATIAHLLGTR